MKRKFLLFLSVIATLSASAQQKTISISGTPQNGDIDAALFRAGRAKANNGFAGKTTAAAPRWYSYADYFDINETASSSSVAYFSQYLWNDTMALMAYSGTSGIEWNHNRMVSVGMVTDPAYDGFNNFLYFDGLMKVTPANAFSVDSVRVTGIYGFRPTNTSVDTIRIAFAYGPATASTDDVYRAKTTNPAVLTRYGLTSGDSMNTYRLHYDSAENRAGGTSIIVKDVILDNSGTSPAYADTLPNGLFESKVQLAAGGVAIPAGNLIGASVSFISGASFPAHDTVFGSSIGYKYNMFRPLTCFRGTSSTPTFAPYSPTDRNNGMFKTLPDTSNGWGGQYIPLWFWSSTGGAASTLQYPAIDFHLICPTCGTVSGVNVGEIVKVIHAEAFPNPANGDVSIPFTLNGAADVTVAISNMLGQVVAAKTIKNTAQGRITFETGHLSPGLYTYSISANGSKTTGRVSVVH